MRVSSLAAATQPAADPTPVVLPASNSVSDSFSQQFDDASAKPQEPTTPRPSTSESGSRPGVTAAGSRKRESSPSTSSQPAAATDSSTSLIALAAALGTLPETPTSSQKDPASQQTQDGSGLPVSHPIVPAAGPAPPPATAPTPAPTAGNPEAPAPLSFAAKIQAPDGSAVNKSAQHMVLNDSVGAVASAWKKGQHDEQPSDASDAPLPGAATPAPALSSLVTTFQPPIAQPVHASPQQTAAPAPVKALDAPLPAQPQAPTGSLKDVSFRIAQPDGSSVQLRMVQQSGELKVAVHAASPDLNQGLRDSLPDLTKKLSDSGFHSETWRPGVSAAPASAEAEAAKNSGSNPQNSDSQSQSGAGQQNRGQRDQNQSQRPQWVEELENGIQSASSFTGELHGISS